jgi:hypothetical protein
MTRKSMSVFFYYRNHNSHVSEAGGSQSVLSRLAYIIVNLSVVCTILGFVPLIALILIIFLSSKRTSDRWILIAIVLIAGSVFYVATKALRSLLDKDKHLRACITAIMSAIGLWTFVVSIFSGLIGL